MKIYDIDWDVTTEELIDIFKNATVDKQSNFLEIPYEKYIKMTMSEKVDYFLDDLHHCPAREDEFLNEFISLPTEVELPENMTNDVNDISDWLEDEYGFYVDGFRFKEK